eukprot:SAG11_NODE_798_length_7127_cov_8.227803_1_plen_125_part_00
MFSASAARAQPPIICLLGTSSDEDDLDYDEESHANRPPATLVPVTKVELKRVEKPPVPGSQEEDECIITAVVTAEERAAEAKAAAVDLNCEEDESESTGCEIPFCVCGVRRPPVCRISSIALHA